MHIFYWLQGRNLSAGQIKLNKMKEVICIKTHSQGLVKNGNIYPLLETKDVKCHCGPKTLYNVGILSSNNTNNKHSTCPNCKYRIPNHTGYRWFDSSLFADLADITELLRVLDEEVKI